MRLARARVQNYRSVKDSGWFEVEWEKTILVGPNEAGKTAIMRALEYLCPGPVVSPLVPLRDYPRSEYSKIQRAEVLPKNIIVTEAHYLLDDSEHSSVAGLSPELADAVYYRAAYMDNTHRHRLDNVPPPTTLGALKDEFRRLAFHADVRLPSATEDAEPSTKPSELLNAILAKGTDESPLSISIAEELREWIDMSASPLVDAGNEEQLARIAELRRVTDQPGRREEALTYLADRLPRMIYFSNYTRVQPSIHLGNLADQIDTGAIDQSDSYNFGNFCLLKLLDFSAREISNLGRAPDPAAGDDEAMQAYRDQLDERTYRLNAASNELTQQIKEIWQPGGQADGGGASGRDYTVRIQADQQYLKVVVEDSLGVEVELDQRSEGFQWLVSFFIVFFAQSTGDFANSILLLDEPGLSLHGLKQREFRRTLSALATSNQLLFTTHSPFLVGPDELDIVRVVEMPDRATGTRVHSDVIADDPASLLPLQEAFGYDMAESLFTQQRNLVLEGLTDYWYVEAVAELLREAGLTDLNETIALVPASSAGKVVYFATILHAHDLRVAALLDSDAAGENAANQEILVHKLGQRGILRTKDAYAGPVAAAQIEDLLRDTLVEIGKSEFGWDVEAVAGSQPARGITDIFAEEIGNDFSKYRLAKGFLRWSRSHGAADLTDEERLQWAVLFGNINQALS